MKHVSNYKIINVTCVCGNKFSIKSNIIDNLLIDICDNCHPFFNDKKKKERKNTKFKNIYNELF